MPRTRPASNGGFVQQKRRCPPKKPTLSAEDTSHIQINNFARSEPQFFTHARDDRLPIPVSRNRFFNRGILKLPVRARSVIFGVVIRCAYSSFVVVVAESMASIVSSAVVTLILLRFTYPQLMDFLLCSFVENLSMSGTFCQQHDRSAYRSFTRWIPQVFCGNVTPDAVESEALSMLTYPQKKKIIFLLFIKNSQIFTVF